MYKTVEYKNYDLVFAPGLGFQFVPLGGIVDVSNTDAVFLKPQDRNILYAFVQDEWAIAKDWTLTTGVRYDHYSDFGSTMNPRLALVWDVAYNFSIKALHGRAFRAPAFAEQYNINNPVALGNPNLRPETITTNELAFAWQPLPSVQTNLTLFKYQMKDMIRFMSSSDPSAGATAQNVGQQKGHGYELEARWNMTRNLRLSGHISTQISTDEATGESAGLAPGRRVFGRADWRFAPFWQFGTAVNYVADREREPGDSRPKIKDYTTVDMTLRREKFAGNWEIRATVSNLFNRDAREPSLAPGNIPFDLPLPGRAFYIQVEHAL
jgi:iron complex outermembrane receptor protein